MNHARAKTRSQGSTRWTLYRRLTAGAFFLVLALGINSRVNPFFSGSMSASRVLETIPVVDPLAAIEYSLASRSVHGTAIIGAGILIGVALVAGPVFCGWVCPLGLALDLNQVVRWRLHRLFGRKKPYAPAMMPAPRITKYALLGVLFGFALIAQLPLFQILSPIGLLARIVLFGSTTGLVVVVGILVLEYIWPRLWCRSLCPLGALYSLVGRYGILRVRINPATAGKILCKKCESRCPMGISIMHDFTLPGRRSVTHPDCTRCGVCTEICPGDVLRLGIMAYPPHSDPGDGPGRLVRSDTCYSLPVLNGPAAPNS